MAKEWPRLSQTLTGPKSPTACQACGSCRTLLWRWLEHDETDKPEPIVVVLCEACAEKLIEPHPRLYRRLHEFEPMPGAMPLCDECRHRDGVRCANPQAQINGGPGLEMKHPRPIHVHVCRRGKGQHSGWEALWQGPVTECSGKEIQPQ